MAEPLSSSGAEGCPPLHLRWIDLREGISHQVCAAIDLGGVPVIHEISQREPGMLALADLLEGAPHRLSLIQIPIIILTPLVERIDPPLCQSFVLSPPRFLLCRCRLCLSMGKSLAGNCKCARTEPEWEWDRPYYSLYRVVSGLDSDCFFLLVSVINLCSQWKLSKNTLSGVIPMF